MTDNRNIRRSFSQDTEKYPRKNVTIEQKSSTKRHSIRNYSETVSLFPSTKKDVEYREERTYQPVINNHHINNYPIKSYVPVLTLQSNDEKHEDQPMFPKLTSRPIKLKKPTPSSTSRNHFSRIDNEYSSIPKISKTLNLNSSPSNDLLDTKMPVVPTRRSKQVELPSHIRYSE
ncbi:hypothetical protein I4U23_020778 [Adineta vaga]|nr:hypothetical protein I4U23_020778 [Adineta vaga]